MMVAALFVDPKGHYPAMPGVDCWPIERDARAYQGQHPVVAHPPCNLWVNFAAQNWARYGRVKPAWYPGGSDDGCFESALASVRRCGGVLEHPAFTHAWKAHGLEAPRNVGWMRVTRTEWVCEVWQSAYGHKARKRTWLLYVSPRRAPMNANWARPTGTHQVGWFDRIKPTLGKREASQTPIEFAEFLVALARRSRNLG